MKRILIPTDFSDNAWNAILYATELFKKHTCKFFILNTYEMLTVHLLAGETQSTAHALNAIKMKSIEGLKITLEDLKSLPSKSNHSFETISEAGSLISSIKNTITKNNIDLVVMSTKGASGAKEIFVGSQAKRVVQSIRNCPVLVVPEDVVFSSMDEIAFATTLSKPYHSSEIESLIDISKNLGALIRLIHVHDKDELSTLELHNLNALKYQLKDIDYCVHTIRNFSTIEKAIQEVIIELELEFLVMIKYKHGLLDKLLREPVIKKMAFHTKNPFLVIPSTG